MNWGVSLRSRYPFVTTALALALSTAAFAGVWRTLSAQRSAPLIVVETTRGTFAFDTYPREAPLSDRKSVV